MHKNKITAVLGPTNTGKTFMAIETMLSFETGMIGFPLRLLAREVYDKIVKKIFSDYSQVCLCPKEIPECICDNEPKLLFGKPKKILPKDSEIRKNRKEIISERKARYSKRKKRN